MIEMHTSLFPYQEEAYRKLRNLKVGALYMDMGTGKTRTMMEIIRDKFRRGKIDRVLWFCPCSAKLNIQRELERHLTQGHDRFLIAGIESMSSSIRLNVYLRRFVQEHRCLLVVDESNKIKNPKAIRTENIQFLAEDCVYRYILNGTPVTRDERDLFAQWFLLDWRILGYKSYYSFERNHVVYSTKFKGKVDGVKNVDYLTRKIAPYTYQIKKEECLDLPKKQYYRSFFSLTPEQRENYQVAGDFLIELLDEELPSTVYRMFNVLQAICSGWDVYVTQTKTLKSNFRCTPRTNPRLALLLEELAVYGNEKVIIFCEFTVEAKAVEKMLQEEYGPDACRLYIGEISQKNRDRHLQDFQGDTQFLIANKDCAGYSLNLQFCNHVIYFNNDWDFGTRSQSEDRVHRIGQTKPVTYRDLVAVATVEERILDNLDKKENLIQWFQREISLNKKKSIQQLLSGTERDAKSRIRVLEENYEDFQ